MELVPYSSREGQIVLRHRDALVVRDHASQRLEIRGAPVPVAECPTCKRPLRSSSPERRFDAPQHHESWVDPQYFRMLQAGHDEQGDPRNGPPSPGPVRRLTQPTLPSSGVTIETVDDVEFVSSASAPQEGARIRRDAFSPNYFTRFFVEERELGRGGKGVVLLVRHEIDGCALGHFACKRVPVGDDHAWLEKVLVEVELLAALSHPNLVSYRHVWLEDVQIHRFGPSVACAFILQQYCNGGDLLRYVIGDQPKEATKEQLKAQLRRRSKGHGERPPDISPSQRRLSLEEIYSLFKDITSGLAYLHSANYIHRDLKPSNCLLHHENDKVKCLISDFGEVQPSNAVRKSTGTTGTISYCAPEVLKMDARGQFGNFTVKSDVFSLGMILYFLCFGRLPYRNANVVQEELEDIDLLRAEIADWKGFQDERRERPDLPPKLYQLLKKMLALNPAERPSATEVLGMLNHESSQGNLRGPRPTSPSTSIPSRRIQNLDSPIPPGTPQPEPTKPQTYSNGGSAHDLVSSRTLIPPPPLEHSPQSLSGNSLLKYRAPGSPRHQSHVMVLSRSQERQPSPDRLAVSHSPQLSPTAHTPLLMPAPTGPLGTFSHRAALYQHRITTFTRVHSASILLFCKLSLFLVKIISLANACWPFLVNLGIGIPLIGAAGLDLAVPSEVSNTGMDSGRSRYATRASSALHWGWKGSLVLLALHFSALWATSRWGHLCVAARDDWVIGDVDW
ncbi:kinase-like domain-containing protein [Xylaria cf. heliscus]|nr:kinase-like domain-containing protein [Xylaria cf. heliscus]